MSARPISPSMLRVLHEAAAGTLAWSRLDYRRADGTLVNRQVRALRRYGLLMPSGYGPDSVTAAGRAALESTP